MASLLTLLKLTPSSESIHFVNQQQQFQLDFLVTEQSHPKTAELSQTVAMNTTAGLQSLFAVDEDISDLIQNLVKDPEHLQTLIQASEAITRAILGHHQVYFYGCGATGRLAKQFESTFWRPFWQRARRLAATGAYPELSKFLEQKFPLIEEQLSGEMTGADRALISSLEGFEDLPLIGKLQLAEHKIEARDIVIAITEGGETSSVIGTILAAAALGSEQNNRASCSLKNLFFVYNNPDNQLANLRRSEEVLRHPGITKIPLVTGPQAIMGSTRMQATTAETFVLGAALEDAIYSILEKSDIPKSTLAALKLQRVLLSERLLSFLPLQEKIAQSATTLAPLVELEAETYRVHRRATYFAGAGLMSVFIDSTERSPTFNLDPLDVFDDDLKTQKPVSWNQIWSPTRNADEAWNWLLRRKFRGLDPKTYTRPFHEQITDLDLREAAERSLKKATNDEKDLYDFSFSARNLKSRGPTAEDFGMLVLLTEDLLEVKNERSIFRDWLSLFTEKKARIGAIIVESHNSFLGTSVSRDIQELSPDAIVARLVLPEFTDPLQLRENLTLKMILNAHSTAVMAKLGRVLGNSMISVRAGNRKLIGRATHLIRLHVNEYRPGTLTYAEANAILFNAIEYSRSQNANHAVTSEIPLAIVRVLEALRRNQNIPWTEAEAILAERGLASYLEHYP